MRKCGECTACCDGNLAATIFSHKMYPGTPCHFLKDKQCSVYSVRPTTCKKYFCAWVQEIVSEQYRPDKCGYLVSVKNSDKNQYFEVIKINENSDKTLLEELDKFTKDHNTFFKVINNE